MRLYATRVQCEQIIIALTKQFGGDEDALKMIKIVSEALIKQCNNQNRRRPKNKKNGRLMIEFPQEEVWT